MLEPKQIDIWYLKNNFFSKYLNIIAYYSSDINLCFDPRLLL